MILSKQLCTALEWFTPRQLVFLHCHEHKFALLKLCAIAQKHEFFF